MSDEGMSDAPWLEHFVTSQDALGGMTFAHYRDHMDDEAMLRYRASVAENNGHDMAPVNYNSLRRIIARLDAAERERDHYRKLAFGRIDQSAANGWMPIACAPTNGSKIDLWSESHYGNGRIPDAWYVGNEWFVLNGNGRPEAIAHHHNVTHWRPIHALTANHSAPVVEE